MAQSAAVPPSSAKTDLLGMYESMQKIRKFEERVATLFADGHIPGFVHLYIGQEATAVGACAALTDRDFITSTHRGHGHLIAKGGDLDRMMAELYGRQAGYCKGRGGSMHIVDVSLGILGANGIVAAGCQIACGSGLSAKVRQTDQVTVSFLGDSATNEGMFHEALNLASVWNLPVVFVVENNLYGQFTPFEAISKVREIADKAPAYGMPGRAVDGNDVLAVREAVGAAIARARAGDGPSLVECKTYRHKGHYEGDVYDYRSRGEIEAWKARDPIPRLASRLIADGMASQQELDAIDKRVDELIDHAVAFSEESPEPDPATLADDVFAPPVVTEVLGSPDGGDEMSFADAIRETLRQEMRRDPSIVLLGEDVAIGIFGVTGQIVEEFGRTRVLDTPLSENVIAGASVGAAMTGLRPVAEIEFNDFLTCCLDPIVNQAAKLRYMTGGQVTVPMVVRTSMGAGFSAAAQHSQNLSALLMHVPGLCICVPSTPADVKGLLTTALRGNNPVVFFEAKAMYYNSGSVPADEYAIPFGKGVIRREGKDVTVVAVGTAVANVESVAERLAGDGISVEIIDPRTLVPLDKALILASVKKTGKLVTVEEACLTGGFGAEIAAIVAKEAFDWLDAPIERVASPDVPVPFAPNLEAAYVPSEDAIEAAIRSQIEA